ncbi:MAG TPA: SDR family oxidoreductase [Actinospica sp.]|jgi:3-oxoacyl-[acyl-carrier protein] reductase|nr:SDR family oxidoreductase [Actinospica sp.]
MTTQGTPLAGRVFLVAGASGAIGAACARTLLELGGDVVAGYNANADALEPLVKRAADLGRTLSPIQADLASPDGPGRLVAAALQAHGRADGCVAAAGRIGRRLALGTSADQLGELLRVNTLGTLEVARACLRPMMRAGYGRIVLVGSRAGVAGQPGAAAYAATKGALQSWAASVAGEVGRHGVTVNVVAPGAIRTAEQRYTAAEEELALRLIGAGRLGEPTEVAAAVAFLSSPQASYINGSVLMVDGGARL